MARIMRPRAFVASGVNAFKVFPSVYSVYSVVNIKIYQKYIRVWINHLTCLSNKIIIQMLLALALGEC